MKIKVGDLITFKGLPLPNERASRKNTIGLAVSTSGTCWRGEERFDILLENGELRKNLSVIYMEVLVNEDR